MRIRHADEAGRSPGGSGPGDFYDGRPAYRHTVEVGIYVKDGATGAAASVRDSSKKPCAAPPNST